MKSMRLDVNKKVGKQRITSLEVHQGTLITEVDFYEYNTKVANMFLADSPEWVRHFVKVNQHNLK